MAVQRLMPVSRNRNTDVYGDRGSINYRLVFGLVNPIELVERRMKNNYFRFEQKNYEGSFLLRPFWLAVSELMHSRLEYVNEAAYKQGLKACFGRAVVPASVSVVGAFEI